LCAIAPVPSGCCESPGLEHRTPDQTASDPTDRPALVDSMGMDVILLNEYVEQRPRPEFKDAVRDHGYRHQLVSFTPAVHNQVSPHAGSRSTKGDLKYQCWEIGWFAV
jgi:hypothetical protein